MAEILIAVEGATELSKELPRRTGQSALYHVREAGTWVASAYKRSEARALFRRVREGKPVQSRWSQDGFLLVPRLHAGDDHV